MKYILSLGILALFLVGVGAFNFRADAAKMVCQNMDCCKANPTATTPNGSPCTMVLQRSGWDLKQNKAAKEKSTPVPTPTAVAPVNVIRINSDTRTVATATPVPAEGKPTKDQKTETIVKSKSNITNNREVAPSPTPVPPSTK